MKILYLINQAHYAFLVLMIRINKIYEAAKEVIVRRNVLDIAISMQFLYASVIGSKSGYFCELHHIFAKKRNRITSILFTGVLYYSCKEAYMNGAYPCILFNCFKKYV